MTSEKPSSLNFPFPDPPRPGEVVTVAPGLLWARLALPFRLDHVNIYLIEDGDGYAVLDTGIANAATRDAWQALVTGPLRGRRLTQLIVSHFHPDHIGLAGWLCETYAMPLVTTQTCYLGCLNISLSPGAMDMPVYADFYRRHGMSEDAVRLVTTQGHSYLHMVAPLPPTFRRLVAGEVLTIGQRRFEVLTGDGHAPEQAMLYCAAERLFLCADQVLAKISPNIGVWAVDPDGDPLGLYLRSLAGLIQGLPADVLVLPGHNLPFTGLHQRCAELIAHHEARCDLIAQACANGPQSVADIVPLLFTRALDPHQMSFAFSEAQGHVNFMIRQQRLIWIIGPDGRCRAALPA